MGPNRPDHRRPVHEANQSTIAGANDGLGQGLDHEANNIFLGVRSSLLQAIDTSYNMPLNDHLYYSGFQTYEQTMSNQRRTLLDMMRDLAQLPANYDNCLDSFENVVRLTEDDSIDNLIDGYDNIQEFSEDIFDRVGQNLDDAAGLLSHDVKMVKETLEAAKNARLSQNPLRANIQNVRVITTTKNTVTPSLISAPQQTQPTPPSSSIHSSSSSVNQNKNIEKTILPTTDNLNPLRSLNTSTSNSCNNSNNNNTIIGTSGSNNSNKIRQPAQSQQSIRVNSGQVNSVVQSVSMQQPRNYYGGYLGKQYGPSQRFAQLENKNIPRPQDNFEDKVDNTNQPFQPIIKEKPNALVPLELKLGCDDHGGNFYSHPYEYELQHFQVDPKILSPTEAIEPPDLYSTPIVLVETVEQLEEMCRIIENEEEFAVDVEHHSYRSFQGITCLLQISTRAQDFVIDAIKLRKELHKLNRSFTNPSIVKVFHGADCDVLWLQRDFGVYVVNLFDTSRAAKLMKFAHLSLAFLMKHYCNVDPDKSYQLADWRERPLPLPMLQYARADTHYLLYIHDRLKHDLLFKSSRDVNVGIDLLRNVFERGREICLKRYEKPPFSDTSHLSVLRKSRSTFSPKQMFAFRELYAWRDSISRELDESVGYVLPNNLMIRIAQYLPREPQGITALCTSMPPTVKKYLSDIHAIIMRAINAPQDEIVKGPTSGKIDPALKTIDLDTINSKQDIAHSTDLHENSVPNLLDGMYNLKCSTDDASEGSQDKESKDYIVVNHEPSRLCNFLSTTWNSKAQQNEKDSRKFKSKPKGYREQESDDKQFVSPYEKYLGRNKNT